MTLALKKPVPDAWGTTLINFVLIFLSLLSLLA